MRVACVASGPSLNAEVLSLAARECESLVMVSDSFRLASPYLPLVHSHVSTDVRWWNEWKGDDFHNRIQHGDTKPFTGSGSTPHAWRETAPGKAYLKTCGHTKLHSGALGLMVAGYIPGCRKVFLVSHDLNFGSAEHTHFFGNHPRHPGWGTPNPSQGNFVLYREQIKRAAAHLELMGVQVVCATPSSLCDRSLMAGKAIGYEPWKAPV